MLISVTMILLCLGVSMESTYSRAGTSGAAAAGSSNSEVDARLVSLTGRLTVPVVLDDTLASGGALAAQVGDGDGEGGLVGGAGLGVGGEDAPVGEGVADDGVAGRVDDGDVGRARVGGADVVGDGDRVADGVALDVGRVVVVLHALAQPEVALVGEVAADQLRLALDVAVRVRAHHVVDLRSALGRHGRAGTTGSGRLDHTVGGDHGDHGGTESDGVLHLVCWGFGKRSVKKRKILICLFWLFERKQLHLCEPKFLVVKCC